MNGYLWAIVIAVIIGILILIIKKMRNPYSAYEGNSGFSEQMRSFGKKIGDCCKRGFRGGA